MGKSCKVESLEVPAGNVDDESVKGFGVCKYAAQGEVANLQLGLMEGS